MFKESREGFAPSFPFCKKGALLLDQRDINQDGLFYKGAPWGSRTPISFLKKGILLLDQRGNKSASVDALDRKNVLVVWQ